MDSSFGNEMAKGFMMFIILVALVFGAAGYGCARGCDYVKAHYTVKVEKKP